MIDTFGRIFRTDLHYVIEGGFWLGIATVANSLMSLVLVYAFANWISPEIYGSYRYLLSLYGILTVATFGGISSAVARSVAKGKEGDLLAGFILQTKVSLVASLAAFAGAAYYLTHENRELAIGLLLIGCAIPLMESSDLSIAFLNGKKLFRLSAIVSASLQMVTTVSLIVAAAINAPIIWLLATYLASWTLARLASFVIIKKHYVKNDEVGVDTARVGMHFTAVNILNTIAGYLDRIMLFQIIGSAELAQYTIAGAPMEQIKGLFKNATTLSSSRFATRTEKELRSTCARKMFLIGGAAMCAVIAYIFLAPSLISFFFPKYINITSLSQIYMISLLGVMNIPPVAAMTALPKMRALYATNTLAPIVNIILTVILIPIYGLLGAVLAKTIGRLANIAVAYATFKFSR